MSEEERHPSKYLREKGTVDFCYKCGQAKAPGCVCIFCGPEEVKEEAQTIYPSNPPQMKCWNCGGMRVADGSECPRCEEQRQLFAEERRRGVRESEEPPPKLLAAQAIEDALPILWQAALYCDEPEAVTKIIGNIQSLWGLKFRLERKP